MNDSIPGWDRQTIPALDKQYGWIQWKGTEVCIDIHCLCGVSTHIDADFVYYALCPACKRGYMLNGHIELVELTELEIRQINKKNNFVVGKI